MYEMDCIAYIVLKAGIVRGCIVPHFVLILSIILVIYFVVSSYT